MYVYSMSMNFLSNLEKSHNMTINIPEGVNAAQLQIQGRKSHEPRQVNSQFAQ